MGKDFHDTPVKPPFVILPLARPGPDRIQTRKKLNSERDMKEWLKKIGFKKIKKIDLSLDSGLIIGYKL